MTATIKLHYRADSSVPEPRELVPVFPPSGIKHEEGNLPLLATSESQPYCIEIDPYDWMGRLLDLDRLNIRIEMSKITRI